MSIRTRSIAGGVVLGLAVAGGAFYGGVQFQRAQEEGVRSQFFSARGGEAEQGGVAPFAGPGPFVRDRGDGPASDGNFPGIVGEVKSLDGDTLTISTPLDVVRVLLTEDTDIQQQIPVGASALQVGQRVSIFGSTDEAGEVTAASIQILGETLGQ